MVLFTESRKWRENVEVQKWARLVHSISITLYLQYNRFSYCCHTPMLKKYVCVCPTLLRYLRLMCLGHSGSIRLRLVCTLTPTKVWSASWSKGKRQNHAHAPLADRPQLAVTHTCCWQALTWIPKSVPWGDPWKSRDMCVTGDPFHWGFLTFLWPLCSPCFERCSVWSVWHFQFCHFELKLWVDWIFCDACW